MNRFKLGRVGKGVCADRVVDRAFRPDLSFLSFFMFLVVDVYYLICIFGSCLATLWC